MGLRVTIDGTGGKLLDRELLAFAERLAVPVAGLQAAATIMRRASEEQFQTEGGHASGGWPELAASTVKERGSAHPILRVTDALFDSMTRKFDSRHIEKIDPSGESLRFGTTVPYAIYHGSTKPRSKIPYRPPLALSESDKVEIIKSMQAAIRGGVASPGVLGEAGSFPL